MLHISKRALMILITTIVAVTLTGTMIGAFVAFFPGPSGSDSQQSVTPQDKQPEPATIPQPAPDPRSATVNGVSLTLSDIRKSVDPKGIEITIDLSNQTSSGVDFSFYPAQALTLSDNIGSNYDFRWAEYKGELDIGAGQKARLVRAFFAGPDRDVSPDRLTLAIVGVPQIGKAMWEIDWPATSPRPAKVTTSTVAPTTEAEKPANGVGGMITQNKVSVTLTSAEVNRQLGGVVVVMAILNNSASDLNFIFSPEQSMAVVDNRGSKFNLKWAEYAGIMNVARGKQVRLVEAFFEGPLSDAATNRLTISVANVPEFGGASWQVPLGR